MRKRIGWMLCLCLSLSLALCCAEQAPQAAEGEQAALQELEPLMTLAGEDAGSQDLGKLTEVIMEEPMSEYADGTGLSFRYPAVLIFSEENGGNVAANAEGTASLWIESMEKDAGLTLETLEGAVKLTAPEAATEMNAEAGTLVVKSKVDEATRLAEIYLFSAAHMHHLSYYYPAADAETWETWLSYLMNSITTEDSPQG